MPHEIALSHPDQAPGPSSFEAELRATTTLLRLMGGCEDLRELAGEVITYLRGWSGCEAVGLRLKEGDDFPYYETRGFPEPFILLESRLCARDSSGGACRDDQGRPVLECMCGNILQGRTDPAQPFFTRAGSFWTNSTSALLAGTTDEDRGAHTRNRCIASGYESVALVPIRRGPEVLGLLQFNDHRQGRFSPELIPVFERFGDCVGIALGEKLAHRDLKEALVRQEWLVRDAYHRVKNNLMVVEGLLRLQSSEIQDPGDLARFQDAMGRVHSMLLIHDKLNRSKDLSSVSAPAYLEGLLSSLLEAYRRPGLVVRVESAIADISLGPTLALGLGLITNELLSNALKHAFPGRAEGLLSVGLVQEGEDLVLSVADDGVGLPEGLEAARGSSLGFLIVSAKTQELGGVMRIDRSRGTRIELRFTPRP